MNFDTQLKLLPFMKQRKSTTKNLISSQYIKLHRLVKKACYCDIKREKNYFLDQQKRCLFFSLKFINIFNKVFFRNLQKNYCAKLFWKSSVLVWQCQNSNMCQHVNKCTSRSTIKCTTSRSTRKCSTSRSTRKCTQVKRMLKQQFITFNS